ncbi:hypothetical protein [Ensifer sp. YR511]|uniref:hypothetical protein n=1 Tax=Ensifer sp. YR511 TaxID=1855294 RepID=UPI00116006D5|nr:hypothetical protein [Ensifer sp. YR511]
MAPARMTPEQAANHLESMGFQVRLSEAERQAFGNPLRRNGQLTSLPRLPNYELKDMNDGATFVARPIEEYSEAGRYAGLPHMPENVEPEQVPTMGLAVHQREGVILSEAERATLAATATTLERQAAKELDWFNDKLTPRLMSGLERIGQIYQGDQDAQAVKFGVLWAKFDEFRSSFEKSLRTDEDNNRENAPAGRRAAREQARGGELPLSSDARRGVIEELDEMLVRHFPEIYASDRSRPQTPAVAVEAADEEMNVAINDRSRASTVIPDSQEEPEQFAQPREMPTPPAPDFRPLDEILAERFPGAYAPDRSRLQTPAAGNAEVEVVDLTAEESSQEGSRRRPVLRQEGPDPFAVTDAQHAFLAQWPHNRQPTFEEMDRLMSEERPSAPANTADNREPSSEPETGRGRPPKRTRDDAVSGDNSPGEGPSRPMQRRRLVPGAWPSSSTNSAHNRQPSSQQETGGARPLKRTRDDAASGDDSPGEGASRPMQRRRPMSDARTEPGSESSEARQGGSGSDAHVHGRDGEDRRTARAEPVIEASGENPIDPGSSTARAWRLARSDETSRRTFDDVRRRRGNGSDRSW